MKTSQVLHSFLDRSMAVGCSAWVWQNGREVFFEAVGQRSAAAHLPFERNTLCHMYSDSKPVAAVAVLQLLDTGRLSLEDPLTRFFPEYERTMVWNGKALEPARPITVRHLLTMTSGIPYPGTSDPGVSGNPVSRAYWELDKKAQCDAEAGHPWTMQDYIRAMADCPLCFQPGSHWLYGLSCDVLGAIVEVISGQSLGEYYQEHIFAPLGMKDTGFALSPEKHARMATIYANDFHDRLLIPWEDERIGYRMTENPFMESAGAGLISCLDDYARFCRMLLNGGQLDGVRILSEKAVEMMRRGRLREFGLSPDALDWDDEKGYDYGFLVRVMDDPEHSYYASENPGAFGWNGKAGTSIRIDPKKGRIVIFMTQIIPPDHSRYLPDLLAAIEEDFGTR